MKTTTPCGSMSARPNMVPDFGCSLTKAFYGFSAWPSDDKSIQARSSATGT